mmetsp:Transcript_9486/g.21716  ORF Transcript_9486/g.21716 Transcript_9486/m.21716 type:complete len:647 (+) Transcript_9486:65-2005(+)
MRSTSPAAVDTMRQLENMAEKVRGIGDIRDFNGLRRFELTVLKLVEGLSATIRTFLEEKEEDARRCSLLRGQMLALQKEHQETVLKYKQSRKRLKDSEGEMQRMRTELVKFQGQYNSKLMECEQLRSQLAFLNSDLREKQKELWNMVCIGQEKEASRSAGGSSHTLKRPGSTTLAAPQWNQPAGRVSPIPNPPIATQPYPRGKPAVLTTLATSDSQKPKEDPLVMGEGVHRFAMGPRFAPLHASLFERERRYTLDDIKSPDFNMFECDEGELLCCLEQIYDEVRLLELLKIPRTKLRTFLLAVYSSYRANPFHNFMHAFCVTQMLFHFLVGSGVGKRFPELDVALLLVAALCHDLDHPGLNNGFQSASRAPLSVMYNDVSVLENYHAASAFHVLRHQEANILSELDAATSTEARALIVKTILSTDMAQHFSFLKTLETKASLDLDTPADRQLLYNMLLKCADVSNEVRPFKVCKRWANNLMEEFFAQGDLEREIGMPVTPMMDREKVTLPKMQTGFCDAILLPAFRAVSRHLPELKHCVERLEANRAIWESISIEDARPSPREDPPPKSSQSQSQSQPGPMSGGLPTTDTSSNNFNSTGSNNSFNTSPMARPTIPSTSSSSPPVPSTSTPSSRIKTRPTFARPKGF